MATFYKEGDSWRAQVARKGIRKSKSGFRTKLEAQAWARATETAVLAQGKRPSKSLHDALGRYAETVSIHKKGERWERVRIALFKRLMDDKGLADLTPDDIARWRDKRLKSVSSGSVRREMNLLGAILQTATDEWGWIEANPMRKVRKPPDGKGRERLVTPEEIDVLLAECRSPLEKLVALAVMFALETGMRAGEIVQDNRPAQGSSRRSG